MWLHELAPLSGADRNVWHPVSKKHVSEDHVDWPFIRKGGKVHLKMGRIEEMVSVQLIHHDLRSQFDLNRREKTPAPAPTE